MSILKAYPSTSNLKPEFSSFWAGQSASLLIHKVAKVLIETLVNEMNKM